MTGPVDEDRPPIEAYEGIGPTPAAKAAAEQESRANDTSHLPPQNLHAEEAVLGAMLMSSVAIETVLAEGLDAHHFYRQSHRVLFDAINACRVDGAVDELTVVAKLGGMTAVGEGGKQVPALPLVGGASSVMSLGERVPAVANARAYAQEVIAIAAKRRFVEIGHEIAEVGYDKGVAPAEAQERAEALVLETAAAAGRKHAQGEQFTSSESIAAFRDRYAAFEDREVYERETLSWGRPEVDERVGRMERGAIYVLAGWTKHGKTWECLDVIEAVAWQQQRSILFSAEMSDKEVTERLVAMGGHDYGKIQDATLPWPKLRERAEYIATWDRETVTGKTTVARIKSLVVKAKLEGKPYRLVVVDHLGLLRPDRGAKFQPRREFVEDAVAELKAHAEEHGYTLLLVAQLSRPERNPKHHPRYKRPPFEGDLKEASGIEQIATCVIFVYRTMDPETGTFVGQEGSFLFPFHRSRPTPKGLAVEFVLPKHGREEGSYRFLPTRPADGVSSPGQEQPVEPVQQSLEGSFGPVVVVTPDDMPIH